MSAARSVTHGPMSAVSALAWSDMDDILDGARESVDSGAKGCVDLGADRERLLLQSFPNFNSFYFRCMKRMPAWQGWST